ncbi:winged helix-turn-helix domain-containing protein [Kibdelosporangium phytohabitans]|uniref:HTH arsR-type domain-containing protein n=1 Tax=Kibdelosporangium phytohabitans TaxID=860235 RepID=A0A0N9HS75_9PSEU|nr:winged helix-turn-helix domain-containing protein [Kibdelosporangium phytohabitans]ALG07772.1 hypothetical protein AOZ06_13400 [Kibdelosporangium phytohabitans]MBE1471314.1 DNA-binding transcriptional ArsR family regulator [Kibdelosporangium phytohabitans]
MLRVHFTPADLGRTHVTGAFDPLSELVTSLRRWRGCDVRALPTWAAELAGGDIGHLRALTDALRGYHRAAGHDHPKDLARSLADDIRRRTQAMARGGVDGLLASFLPLLRWRRPVLETAYPVAKDVHLNGRGLLLVPSRYCCGTPVTFDDPRSRPVLVYPLIGWQRPPRPLMALLGNTRACVLHATAMPSTTSELARQLGISTASASEHATVLRKAGLIASQRDANSVLHALTRLGEDLLRSC